MRFQGALIKEQGVTFGIIIVKPYVLAQASAAAEMRRFGMRAFGAIPIVLMAQNHRGIPTYQGRKDIVNFLASVPMQAIPWREYTVS